MTIDEEIQECIKQRGIKAAIRNSHALSEYIAQYDAIASCYDDVHKFQDYLKKIGLKDQYRSLIIEEVGVDDDYAKEIIEEELRVSYIEVSLEEILELRDFEGGKYHPHKTDIPHNIDLDEWLSRKKSEEEIAQEVFCDRKILRVCE